MSEGHGAISNSEIWAGVFFEIPSCCSDAEYAAALEDIPATGSAFGSLSPPSFIQSYDLTKLNLEVVLTNRSSLTYLFSL